MIDLASNIQGRARMARRYMPELRCCRCGWLLAKDESGITEVKRSNMEMRAYGINTVAIKCPRCEPFTETIFVRTSGQLVEPMTI